MELKRPPIHIERLLNWGVMLPKRVGAAWRDRNRDFARAGLLATLRTSVERSREWNLHGSGAVHNAGLFVLLLDQDIHLFMKQMLRAPDHEERQFVARQVASLLFEALEDVPQLFGKPFHDALERLGLGPAHLGRVKALTKEVAKLSAAHGKRLKEVRIMTSAHREQDALEQLRVLESIEPLSIMTIVAEFSAPLNGLVRLMSDILLELRLPRLMKDLMHNKNK